MGIPFALQALAAVARQQEVEITLIGDASKDPTSQLEKEKILQVIHTHQLADQVRLLGYQPYEVMLQEAYNYHLFLSPSITASSGDTEGGAPVAIIEMLATGMPMVSTRHCDIPEVVGPGYIHLLAEERDVAGLVERIEWLVANPTEWPALIAAGRQHIEQEYDARTQGRRLAAVYGAIIGRP
jgi:colanic acid/amylovoran biosynthesis glycosyltransferase